VTCGHECRRLCAIRERESLRRASLRTPVCWLDVGPFGRTSNSTSYVRERAIGALGAPTGTRSACGVCDAEGVPCGTGRSIRRIPPYGSRRQPPATPPGDSPATRPSAHMPTFISTLRGVNYFCRAADLIVAAHTQTGHPPQHEIPRESATAWLSAHHIPGHHVSA
jgi:hypothetical protein